MPRTPKNQPKPKPGERPPPPVETFSRPFEQEDTLTVATLDQLKVISDPLRLEILETVVNEARTVKQVAGLLKKPPTQLYYHMSALEGAGFVTVVETRIKSGIIEKYYRTVAQNLKVDPKLLKSGGGAVNEAVDSLLSTIFDSTADEIRQSAAAGLIEWSSKTQGKQKTIVIGRSLYRLDPDRVPKYVEKLRALMDEMDKEEQQGGELNYACTIAFYPRTPAAATAKPKRQSKRSAK